MCASLSCIIACLAHVYKATWALQKKRVLIGEERHTVLNVFIYLLGITWLHFVLLHLHLLWFHLSDRICILEKKKKTLLGKKNYFTLQLPLWCLHFGLIVCQVGKTEWLYARCKEKQSPGMNSQWTGSFITMWRVYPQVQIVSSNQGQLSG